MPGRVTLKAGRDKPLRQRHPWVFSGAVASLEGVEDGATADVFSSGGEWLARGYVNRRSQIVVRVLTTDPEQVIDEGFWRERIWRAARLRDGSEIAAERRDGPERGVRLVNAESDGLPGFVADRYGAFIVAQALTLGIERVKPLLGAVCLELPGVRGVYERSDADTREKEGLGAVTGLLAGEEPPDAIEIVEPGPAGPLRFLVDVRRGQKTGFYLDQRANRLRVAPWCGGREVLNLFSYTGGFAVHALAAGAAGVTSVDTSAEALGLAERNLALNGLTPREGDLVAADAFSFVRKCRAERRRFGAIIIDPPKLAPAIQQVSRASRAYKDLNLVAMQILEPGGILATFSCSGLVSTELFQKIVFGASVDARRDVQILDRLSAPPDHPVLLGFPEGEYLKGLICRVP